MHTVMTTNNAYDSILLINDSEQVVSAWPAVEQTLNDFVDMPDASEWCVNEWQTFDDPAGEDNEPELRTIAAYGTECGRDGKIESEERLRFWFPQSA